MTSKRKMNYSLDVRLAPKDNPMRMCYNILVAQREKILFVQSRPKLEDGTTAYNAISCKPLTRELLAEICSYRL